MKLILNQKPIIKIFKKIKKEPMNIYDHLNAKSLRLVIILDIQEIPQWVNSPFILVLFTSYYENKNLWRAFVIMLILELRAMHQNLVFVFVGTYAESIMTETCFKDDKRFLMMHIMTLLDIDFEQINKHLGMHRF